MKFTSDDGQGLFYALHKSLAKDTAGYVFDTISSIIRDRPVGHLIGYFINGGPRETETADGAGQAC